jgi:hypothetical protein
MLKHKNTQSRQRSLYCARNWAEYDKALVERGSITVWMSVDFEKIWCYTGPSQRGGQFDYSEQAIKIMLAVNPYTGTGSIIMLLEIKEHFTRSPRRFGRGLLLLVSQLGNRVEKCVLNGGMFPRWIFLTISLRVPGF